MESDRYVFVRMCVCVWERERESCGSVPAVGGYFSGYCLQEKLAGIGEGEGGGSREVG